MEHEFPIAPELRDVLAELSNREPLFHRAEFGTSRADFEKMMAQEFCEVGASGRCYSREFVLDELGKRFSSPHEDVWETGEFQCRSPGEDTYLLTHLLLQNHVRLTRRATIWRKTPDGWKILYHQGTVVQDA